MKLKYVITITIAIMSISCAKTEPDLSNARKPTANTPIKIILKSTEGIILQYGDGSIAQYPKSYYISKTVIESNLQTGDWLVPPANLSKRDSSD